MGVMEYRQGDFFLGGIHGLVCVVRESILGGNTWAGVCCKGVNSWGEYMGWCVL